MAKKIKRNRVVVCEEHTREAMLTCVSDDGEQWWTSTLREDGDGNCGYLPRNLLVQ